MLSAERQSAQMSKITNDGLTRSGTGCIIAVWQQWLLVSLGLVSDGYINIVSCIYSVLDNSEQF